MITQKLQKSYSKLCSIILILFLLVSLSGCSKKEVQKVSTSGGSLEVHYIDVGQADSILIKTPSGKNLLIDAGNNDDSDLVVNYLKSEGIKKLDGVIGTHPHEDHIGGLDVVIDTFDIDKVYLPKASSTTRTFKDVLSSIKNKNLKIIRAKKGVKLDLGNEIKAEILAPNKDKYEETNNYSAVLKLEYGDTSFLFTGDAEKEVEEEILASGTNIDIDVLKLGHHGSSSSTTAEFLKKTSPNYIVISVGNDNKYGHPHQETIDKINKLNVPIYRTDKNGTIVAFSDGQKITFKTDKESAKKLSKPQSSPVKEESTTIVSNLNDVKITNIDLRKEIVTITNNSSENIDLSGWKLVSKKGNQTFDFPKGTFINKGESLSILSGEIAKESNEGLVWTKKNIWNNDSDPGLLYNSEGELVSEFN